MKPLLERLKPEIREIFDQEAKSFPNTIFEIDRQLSEKYFVDGLTLGVVCCIASVTGLKEHLGVKYGEMFMPCALKGIFYDITLDAQN